MRHLRDHGTTEAARIVRLLIGTGRLPAKRQAATMDTPSPEEAPDRSTSGILPKAALPAFHVPDLRTPRAVLPIHRARRTMQPQAVRTGTALLAAHSQSRQAASTTRQYAIVRGTLLQRLCLQQHGPCPWGIAFDPHRVVLHQEAPGYRDMIHPALQEPANRRITCSDTQCSRSIHQLDVADLIAVEIRWLTQQKVRQLLDRLRVWNQNKLWILVVPVGCAVRPTSNHRAGHPRLPCKRRMKIPVALQNGEHQTGSLRMDEMHAPPFRRRHRGGKKNQHEQYESFHTSPKS